MHDLVNVLGDSSRDSRNVHLRNVSFSREQRLGRVDRDVVRILSSASDESPSVDILFGGHDSAGHLAANRAEGVQVSVVLLHFMRSILSLAMLAGGEALSADFVQDVEQSKQSQEELHNCGGNVRRFHALDTASRAGGSKFLVSISHFTDVQREGDEAHHGHEEVVEPIDISQEAVGEREEVDKDGEDSDDGKCPAKTGVSRRPARVDICFDTAGVAERDLRAVLMDVHDEHGIDDAGSQGEEENEGQESDTDVADVVHSQMTGIFLLRSFGFRITLSFSPPLSLQSPITGLGVLNQEESRKEASHGQEDVHHQLDGGLPSLGFAGLEGVQIVRRASLCVLHSGNTPGERDARKNSGSDQQEDPEEVQCGAGLRSRLRQEGDEDHSDSNKGNEDLSNSDIAERLRETSFHVRL